MVVGAPARLGRHHMAHPGGMAAVEAEAAEHFAAAAMRCRVFNLELVIELHPIGGREQAMHLMTHDAFQQESEAAGKWVRAQLTSAQLPTYFVGAQEHFDTRKAAQEKLGDQFNLKAYHDKMLSYGAPPVRFARQLMLDQPIE